MTIHLESAKIKQKTASLHLRQSLQRLKKYHERNGMPYSCGWVLENGSVKGVHAHIALHRPAMMPMHPTSYWWASLRCFQVKRSKGVLQCRRFHSWQSFDRNLSEILDYMLKGLRPDVAEILNCPHTDQGLIYGKRIGWSRGRNVKNKP